MNHDLLESAFDALREDASARDASQESATRARILAIASTQKRRRLTTLRLVLPLAAVLAASTVWAASGGHLTHLYSMTSALFKAKAPAHFEDARSTAISPTAVPIPTPPPTATPDPGFAISPSELPSGPVLAPRAPSRERITSKAIASSAQSQTAPPVIDDETRRYRAAHEAHFIAHDPTQALELWNAYLSRYPSGLYAPEAQYNRALSLLRLERREEARRALLPFAHGDFAGYRQAEAKALLDRLDAP